jgi:hypothetical protein
MKNVYKKDIRFVYIGIPSIALILVCFYFRASVVYAQSTPPYLDFLDNTPISITDTSSIITQTVFIRSTYSDTILLQFTALLRDDNGNTHLIDVPVISESKSIPSFAVQAFTLHLTIPNTATEGYAPSSPGRARALVRVQPGTSARAGAGLAGRGGDRGRDRLASWQLHQRTLASLRTSTRG